MKIILDVLAPLAITSEPPSDDFLDRKMYSKTESLFSRSVAKNIVGHSIYQVAVVLIMLFAGENLFHVPQLFVYTENLYSIMLQYLDESVHFMEQLNILISLSLWT